MVNKLRDWLFKRGIIFTFFYKTCIWNDLVRSLILKGINRFKLRKRSPPLIIN